MLLSIIIVSWNTKDLLRDCLTSIYEQYFPYESEIWVVDNSSDDDSPLMVERHFPQVKLLKNTQNVGFARANNQAIFKAEGKYILLLNPDTVLCERALIHLVEYLEKRPEVGAAGSKLLNADGSLQTSCYPAPTLFREFWRMFYLDKIYPFGVYSVDTWDQNKPRPVDVVMGASLMVKGNLLRKLNGLDESYYIYTEEVDLCYRIRADGFGIHWVPSSIVTHFGGQSTRQVANKMFLQLYRSKIQYFRKNYGGRHAFIYKTILLMASIFRALLSPIAMMIFPSRRGEYSTLVRNYFDLILALPKM